MDLREDDLDTCDSRLFSCNLPHSCLIYGWELKYGEGE